MKGDFSRTTFDPHKHYTSVRMQQGRVQLDADWNEQVDILLGLIQTQLSDMLGSAATPAAEPGFAITPVEATAVPQLQESMAEESASPDRRLPDFYIGAGRCYVEGVLCENETPMLFSQQPDYPAAASLVNKPADHNAYLIYLDVWSRHITAIEDPAIREIALGGADTTTRFKTVWQAKLLPLSADPAGSQDIRSSSEWRALIEPIVKKRQLKARWDPSSQARLGNHLYRVEIHSIAGDQVTFKWSRENGTVVFPITALLASEEVGAEIRLTVQGLDRDPLQLQQGYWVELVDDVTQLNGISLPLCQVADVNRVKACVTLQADPKKLDHIRAEIAARALQHPVLRCWEADEAVIVRAKKKKGEKGLEWMDLENGIQIAFSKSGASQVGDYWLIPARTDLEAGIDWPTIDDEPLAQAPQGIQHHYAPLAMLHSQKNGWAIPPQEDAAFHDLPHLTARLAGTDGRLDNILASIKRIDKTMTTIVQQTHVFEFARSVDKLEAGDLAALDYQALESIDSAMQDTDLLVRLASAADNELVIGVVWEALQDDDLGRYRVVLHGRARVKVLGRIVPGDLLAASDRPGYARKAEWTQRLGANLGKALGFTRFDPDVVQKLEEGTLKIDSDLSEQPGTVEVLVGSG